MKNFKSTESFCLSILTIYRNDWSTFWHVYFCHVHFFSARFLNMCKPTISFDGLVHLDWHFMEVGKYAYWADWGWWMQAGSIPCDQKFSYKWNLSFLLIIISSLFSHFCLFQNAILHKILKLRFWNFKSIFVRMQLSLVATFFLVLIICSSWYLHLELSHEFFTFIWFNTWR